MGLLLRLALYASGKDQTFEWEIRVSTANALDLTVPGGPGMEAFSEPCAWHPSPDLASNAMPYPFLIQVPLPDLFSSCAAAYYLRDSKSLLLGSTIKQTHCILKCVFHHNTKGQFPRFYNKVQNSYFTRTTLTFFFF